MGISGIGEVHVLLVVFMTLLGLDITPCLVELDHLYIRIMGLVGNERLHELVTRTDTGKKALVKV